MSQVGTSIGQQSLYIAEGLYTPDDFDVTERGDGSRTYQLREGLPKPSANVAPGDIKYRDLNKDCLLYTSTDEEQKIVDEWLRESEENREEYEGMRRMYEKARCV